MSLDHSTTTRRETGVPLRSIHIQTPHLDESGKAWRACQRIQNAMPSTAKCKLVSGLKHKTISFFILFLMRFFDSQHITNFTRLCDCMVDLYCFIITYF